MVSWCLLPAPGLQGQGGYIVWDPKESTCQCPPLRKPQTRFCVLNIWGSGKAYKAPVESAEQLRSVLFIESAGKERKHSTPMVRVGKDEAGGRKGLTLGPGSLNGESF